MKIAITGCNGTVGKAVVREALAQGYSVVGIDKAATTELTSMSTKYFFIQADLAEYSHAIDALRGCEAVIHLAGVPGPRDYIADTHNHNVVMSWNVLRAAAELGITRISQASSVNVIAMQYCLKAKFDYFPIDESHPCLPDEPYGLSKVMCELQADTIVRRYPQVRIASIRPHWCVASRAEAREQLQPSDEHMPNTRDGLWGYVRNDCVAKALLLALNQDHAWSGHEAFFTVAPDTIADSDSEQLRQKYWNHVPVKEGISFEGKRGFFDCSKAEKLLGWVHPPEKI